MARSVSVMVSSTVIEVLSGSWLPVACCRQLVTGNRQLFRDLRLRQIARRIFRPVVAVSTLGARAEVAVADVQPLAGGAAAAQVVFAIAQTFEQRDVRIGPDLREL